MVVEEQRDACKVDQRRVSVIRAVIQVLFTLASKCIARVAFIAIVPIQYNHPSLCFFACAVWRALRSMVDSSKWVGLLDVGGAQEGLGVLALDDQLMVAFESARAGAGARRGSGTVATGAVKYRLLVRQ